MKDNLFLLFWNIAFAAMFLYENLTTDEYLKFIYYVTF